MKEKVFKILKYALVALFVSYYCESTFFFHSHTFTWGTVTHSHPYNPNTSHSHTSAEFQTISQLSSILCTLAQLLSVLAVAVGALVLFSSKNQSTLKQTIIYCSLRAPPKFIYEF